MSIQTIVKNLTATLTGSDNDTVKAEVTLASAIAICLEVPGESNGSNGRGYYNANHLEYAKKLVNAVNEEFMIDVDTTLKLVAELYTYRFNTVHEVNATLAAFNALVGCAYGNIVGNEMNCPTIDTSELKSLVIALHDLK